VRHGENEVRLQALHTWRKLKGVYVWRERKDPEGDFKLYTQIEMQKINVFGNEFISVSEETFINKKDNIFLRLRVTTFGKKIFPRKLLIFL
jgi:hypothetical protein